MTEPAPEPNRSRGLPSVLADWLSVRRPTRLVVDGLLLLIVFVPLGQIGSWLAWSEQAAGSADPLALRTYALRWSNIVNALGSIAYFAGIVLVAVGLARIIADAITRARG